MLREASRMSNRAITCVYQNTKHVHLSCLIEMISTSTQILKDWKMQTFCIGKLSMTVACVSVLQHHPNGCDFQIWYAMKPFEWIKATFNAFLIFPTVAHYKAKHVYSRMSLVIIIIITRRGKRMGLASEVRELKWHAQFLASSQPAYHTQCLCNFPY